MDVTPLGIIVGSPVRARFWRRPGVFWNRDSHGGAGAGEILVVDDNGRHGIVVHVGAAASATGAPAVTSVATVLAAALVAQQGHLGAAVGGGNTDVRDLLANADGLGELHCRAASHADDAITA